MAKTKGGNTTATKGKNTKGGKIPATKGQSSRTPVTRAVETPESYGIVLPTSKKARWEFLGKKKMLPTRWPDEDCMEAMGIKEDVTKLFDRAGWSDMMGEKWETYRSITLEFLATLTVKRDEHTRQPTDIIFRMKNEPRNLSIKELEKIYGVKRKGNYFINREQCEDYWRAMVEYPGSESRPYIAKSAKGSSLRNPVLRYIHRVIACTIFGRKETGPISVREVYLIAHLLDGTTPATGAVIANHFEDVATREKGDICIGGMITPIALHYDVDLEEMTPLAGNKLISIPVLKSMNMLDYETRLIFLQNDGDHFLLPNTPLTTIDSVRDLDNIQMATEDHRKARMVAGLASPGRSSTGRNVRRRITGNEGQDERMEEETAFEDEDEESDGGEQEEQAGDRPESSRQGEERHAPAQRTLREEVVALRNDFTSFRDETQRKQDEILSLVRQMHEWHVQQSHFPPPPY
ncbi:hypothetical protein OROGR_023233 [Orobanche gracilis]